MTFEVPRSKGMRLLENGEGVFVRGSSHHHVYTKFFNFFLMFYYNLQADKLCIINRVIKKL